MNVPSIDIVFRCVIAEQTQIEKIRGTRQEFERSKIPLVKRRGVGPYPANAVFLQKTNDLRSVPSGMTKFNRETEIARQLRKKFTQRRFAIFWGKGGRKLDENDLELRCKRGNGAKE